MGPLSCQLRCPPHPHFFPIFLSMTHWKSGNSGVNLCNSPRGWTMTQTDWWTDACYQIYYLPASLNLPIASFKNTFCVWGLLRPQRRSLTRPIISGWLLSSVCLRFLKNSHLHPYGVPKDPRKVKLGNWLKKFKHLDMHPPSQLQMKSP